MEKKVLHFKKAEYDLAVKVIQTTCDTTEETAINALNRIVHEIRRPNAETNRVEIAVLRDAFP